MANNRKFGQLFYNAITYLGVMISIIVLVIEVFLFFLDLLSDGSNLYFGLVTYLILPGFLLLGLGLIPLGVFWKWRRLKKGISGDELKPFRLDLAIPAHRNMILVFIIGTAVLVAMSLVGSYQAYHYTESTKFCGTLCHKIMNPEYVVYQNSPHGKVKCVECHIGSGADWFVKAKLSGLRQVYNTIMGGYSCPIPTPLENLRPAQDTCMECHWPGKFFSTYDFRRNYYLPQKDNPKWMLRMSMNVGGGKDQSTGVHAHMNIDNDIFFVAEDKERQKITWIKSTRKDGVEQIFTSKDSKYKETLPPADLIKKMDCIDCHNRPSHQFQPPDRLIDAGLERNNIPQALPDIREQGVEFISREYENVESANRGIEIGLNEFYAKKYPELLSTLQPLINQSVAAIQAIYGANMFPEMKARWDAHPDNIGHMFSKGCFRCHDNKHKNNEGVAITNKCDSCHVILEQGPIGKTDKSLDGLEFLHPDDDEEWKTTACTKCHA